MVTPFDHLMGGTPEAVWQQDGTIWRLPALAPPPGVHLVVVAAHPDDESLGAGGLVAQVLADGGSAEVLVATDGDASHPGSPTWTPKRLAARRRQEVTEAVLRLGAPAPTLLGLPDGRLAEHTDRLTEALGQIVRTARSERMTTWLVAPWSTDRHPDHDAAGRVALQVGDRYGLTVLEYPVWAWHWATPDAGVLPWSRLRALRLSVRDRSTKAAATACHVSQVAPLSPAAGDEAVLPAAIADHFRRDVEVFVVSRPVPGRTELDSLPAAYFDDLYDRSGEQAPWGLEQGWYERRKRALLLAVLPRERYALAVEPGCAVGLLTVELAARCDRVVAVDTAGRAVHRTRQRAAETSAARIADGGPPLGAVEVRLGALPDGWPELGDARPDLVVLSEIGYYLDAADWAEVLSRVTATLAPGGHLVACHWRHPAPGYPSTAQQVHQALRQADGLVQLARHEEEDFLLDVLAAPPAGSVARVQGLLG